MLMLFTLSFLLLSGTAALAQTPTVVPPPLPGQVQQLYYYNGPSGAGQYDLDRVAELITQDRGAQHLLWRQGWSDWKPWDEVDAVVQALAPTPPPLPVARPILFSYHGPDGQSLELEAAEVARRVRAEDGAHLVWRAGMAAWTDASELAEIQAALDELPPPLPTTSPLPPPVPAPPVVATGPAEPPPAQLPVDEPEGASCCVGDTSPVKLGGEVWFGLSAEDLQNAASDDGEPFTPGFIVQRARFAAKVDLTEHIAGKLMVDFPLDRGTSSYTASTGSIYQRLAALEGSADSEDEDITVDVRDYPDGWSTILKDAYLDWGFGRDDMHRVRAGLQKPVFGSRDWFDGYDDFFLGGLAAYKSLAWRAGLVDTRDLGFSYRVAPSELWALDAQVLNGTGDGGFDDNAGKDVIGRLSMDLPVGLGLQASGLYGARDAGGASSVSQLDASLRFDFLMFRLMAEGLYGTLNTAETAMPFGGFLAAGAAGVPLPLGALERLDVTGRFLYFDPYLQDPDEVQFPDAWWATSVALFLHWDVGCGQRLLTGASFENLSPQNLDVDVENTLVGQVVWRY
jgi:hypothetical protein